MKQPLVTICRQKMLNLTNIKINIYCIQQTEGYRISTLKLSVFQAILRLQLQEIWLKTPKCTSSYSIFNIEYWSFNFHLVITHLNTLNFYIESDVPWLGKLISESTFTCVHSTNVFAGIFDWTADWRTFTFSAVNFRHV